MRVSHHDHGEVQEQVARELARSRTRHTEQLQQIILPVLGTNRYRVFRATRGVRQKDDVVQIVVREDGEEKGKMF